MGYFLKYNDYLKILEKRVLVKTVSELKDKISKLKIPQELKDDAIALMGNDKLSTKIITGTKHGTIVSGLNLHADLRKKISEKDLPSGFSMGIDKNGYFISTHRARSKSYESPSKISVKDIKFIDSTG